MRSPIPTFQHDLHELRDLVRVRQPNCCASLAVPAARSSRGRRGGGAGSGGGPSGSAGTAACPPPAFCPSASPSAFCFGLGVGAAGASAGIDSSPPRQSLGLGGPLFWLLFLVSAMGLFRSHARNPAAGLDRDPLHRTVLVRAPRTRVGSPDLGSSSMTFDGDAARSAR